MKRLKNIGKSRFVYAKKNPDNKKCMEYLNLDPGKSVEITKTNEADLKKLNAQFPRDTQVVSDDEANQNDFPDLDSVEPKKAKSGAKAKEEAAEA